jgi:acetate kinase
VTTVLVVNSGSSSFKYQLIDVERSETLASGLIERIGAERGHARHRHEGPENDSVGSTWDADVDVPDHFAAFDVMLDAFAAPGPSLETHAPVAIGHRVVQGGARFVEPTVITERVKAEIDELAALAPLHNPANLAGIDAAERAFPDVPHVAVFDTAFFADLPPAAATYATGSAPQSVAVGHFNTDSDPDLAVVRDLFELLQVFFNRVRSLFV